MKRKELSYYNVLSDDVEFEDDVDWEEMDWIDYELTGEDMLYMRQLSILSGLFQPNLDYFIDSAQLSKEFYEEEHQRGE